MSALMEDDGGDQVLRAEDIERATHYAYEPSMSEEGAAVPNFPRLTVAEEANGNNEYRRIRVPPHRLTPLRQDWNLVMQPVVEHLLLQIRYNPQARAVELKTSEHTTDAGAIQKGADFVQV